MFGKCKLLSEYFTINDNLTKMHDYEIEYLELFNNDINALVDVNGRRFNLLHFVCHFYYTHIFTLDFIQKIINHIEDINAKDGHSETALFIACYLNYNCHKNDLIKLLLSNGADPYVITKNQKPLIMELMLFEMYDSLDVILQSEKSSFNVNLAFAKAHMDVSELFQYTTLPSVEMIEKLIDNGLNISKICNQNTLLHVLLQEYGLFIKLNVVNKTEKLKSIMMLLANKYLDRIDVNLQNNQGKTILHLALTFDFKPLIKLILKNKKINVNLKDNLGYSALHYCCKMSQHKYLKPILRSSEKIDSTALSIAIHNYLLADNKLHRKMLHIFNNFSNTYHFLLVEHLESINNRSAILFNDAIIVNNLCSSCGHMCNMFDENNVCKCCEQLKTGNILIL